MKLKLLLVAHEKNLLQQIPEIVHRTFPHLLDVTSITDPKDAKLLLQLQKVDLLFLSMQFPNGNGFDLLNELPKPLPQILAFSPSTPFFINALKFSSIPYLPSTFQPAELIELASPLINRCLHLNSGSLAKSKVDKIAVPSITGMDFIDIHEILRCEADSNYTTVFFHNDRKTVISKPLRHFESELLAHSFLRVHHKHLINLKMIKSYSKGKGGGFVVLTNNQTIPVSVRKKPLLMEAFTL